MSIISNNFSTKKMINSYDDKKIAIKRKVRTVIVSNAKEISYNCEDDILVVNGFEFSNVYSAITCSEKYIICETNIYTKKFDISSGEILSI